MCGAFDCYAVVIPKDLYTAALSEIAETGLLIATTHLDSADQNDRAVSQIRGWTWLILSTEERQPRSLFIKTRIGQAQPL